MSRMGDLYIDTINNNENRFIPVMSKSDKQIFKGLSQESQMEFLLDNQQRILKVTNTLRKEIDEINGMKIEGDGYGEEFLQSPPYAKLVLEGATIDTTLGEYLKLRGITQVWLSDMIGVDKTTIINIIKKPSSISLLNAYKISKLLSEDIEYLFPFLQGE